MLRFLTRSKPAFPILNSKKLDTMRFGLHIKFGYGIVLLEILRNTLVLKSGETRSFVFVLDNFTELLIKLSVKYV
ncbi:MAG: hypothetical protein K0S80_3305 [Neobacillus sp.]|nr:hypothetical protein [Neobacillus sp.]